MFLWLVTTYAEAKSVLTLGYKDSLVWGCMLVQSWDDNNLMIYNTESLTWKPSDWITAGVYPEFKFGLG